MIPHLWNASVYWYTANFTTRKLVYHFQKYILAELAGILVRLISHKLGLPTNNGRFEIGRTIQPTNFRRAINPVYFTAIALAEKSVGGFQNELNLKFLSANFTKTQGRLTYFIANFSIWKIGRPISKRNKFETCRKIPLQIFTITQSALLFYSKFLNWKCGRSISNEPNSNFFGISIGEFYKNLVSPPIS